LPRAAPGRLGYDAARRGNPIPAGRSIQSLGPTASSMAKSKIRLILVLVSVVCLDGCASTPREISAARECDIPRFGWDELQSPPANADALAVQAKSNYPNPEVHWFQNGRGDLILCRLPTDPTARDYSRSRPGCGASKWTIAAGTLVVEQRFVTVCSD